MSNGLEPKRQENKGVSKRTPIALFVAAIAAINAALLFCAVAPLSWQECVVVVLVTTALAGGTVFTVLEMQRLERNAQ
jgi:hypothetical protein